MIAPKFGGAYADNSIRRMGRPGRRSVREFSEELTTSPMPRQGVNGVAGGLVNVSASKGNMMRVPRDAGNRPSGVVRTYTLADRAPVLIRNAQGPHAVGFPPGLSSQSCPQCSNYDAAGRGPAEDAQTTLTFRFSPRA